MPPSKKKAAAKKPAKKKENDDPIARIMAQLEKYDEGTPPRSIEDLGCSCLGAHSHKKKEDDE